MTTISISATGRAPAELVWERYTMPSLWPSWSPQISRVACDDEVIKMGSTGVVFAVGGVRVRFEVTEVDVLTRQWAWTAELPLGIGLALRHSVSAIPRGTRTGLRVTGSLPVVLGYLPVARLALHRLVAAPSLSAH